MIKKTINNVYELQAEFNEYNRGDQFSIAGLELIFDLFNETEEVYNLDVIGLCCEFSEYDLSEDDIIADHGYLVKRDEEDTDEEYLENLISEIESRTFTMRDGDTFVIQNF